MGPSLTTEDGPSGARPTRCRSHRARMMPRMARTRRHLGWRHAATEREPAPTLRRPGLGTRARAPRRHVRAVRHRAGGRWSRRLPRRTGRSSVRSLASGRPGRRGRRGPAAHGLRAAPARTHARPGLLAGRGRGKHPAQLPAGMATRRGPQRASPPVRRGAHDRPVRPSRACALRPRAARRDAAPASVAGGFGVVVATTLPTPDSAPPADSGLQVLNSAEESGDPALDVPADVVLSPDARVSIPEHHVIGRAPTLVDETDLLPGPVDEGVLNPDRLRPAARGRTRRPRVRPRGGCGCAPPTC